MRKREKIKNVNNIKAAIKYKNINSFQELLRTYPKYSVLDCLEMWDVAQEMVEFEKNEKNNRKL